MLASIAKTKPRRSTVVRTNPIVLLPPDSCGNSDEALNGPATADYDPVALDRHEDVAQSFSHGRGVRDTEDASTQCDDKKRGYTLKIGLKNLRCLSIQSKPTSKGVKRTIRDMLPWDKVYGTSG